MNKWLIVLVVLIVLVGGGLYLSKQTAKHAAIPTAQQQMIPSTAPSAMQKTSASSSASESQSMTIEGNEFAFTPATLTVKKGQPVTITFKNTGKYPHNFTVSDLNVQSKTIKTGEEDTVTFTPDKAGSFTYICTVPGHADKGMKGTITVK